MCWAKTSKIKYVCICQAIKSLLDRSWYYVIVWMQRIYRTMCMHTMTRQEKWMMFSVFICFHYIVFTFAHLNSNDFRCMSWPSNISSKQLLPAESLVEILNQSASEVSHAVNCSPRCLYSTVYRLWTWFFLLHTLRGILKRSWEGTCFESFVAHVINI